MEQFLMNTSLSLKHRLLALVLGVCCGTLQAQTIQQSDEAYAKKDYKTALEGYRKLANQGNVIAQFQMGLMAHNGEGQTKDDSKALTWYRKAADQGNSNAQFNLGLMYYNGEGVSKNDQQAVSWLLKSAQQGNALAQSNLVIHYFNGQGVPKDLEKAYYWLLISSQPNDPAAMKNLALLQSGLTPEQQAKVKASAMEFKPK
jgi:TPR repeat protein